MGPDLCIIMILNNTFTLYCYMDYVDCVNMYVYIYIYYICLAEYKALLQTYTCFVTYSK